DRAHAALADLLEELVRSNHAPGGFRRGLVGGGTTVLGRRGAWHAAGFAVSPQEPAHLAAQLLVAGTDLVQVGVPVLRPVLFHGVQEDHLHFSEVHTHGTTLL